MISYTENEKENVLPFEAVFHSARVLITGHTGFCGGWLTTWLNMIGAKVTGVSLSPNTRPNLFEIAEIEELVEHHILDIRDYDLLAAVVKQCEPDFVFHLAAQPLVRQSYSAPLETFTTNVLGTVNLLEACRTCLSIKSIVVITTDKVYQNQEWYWGYREIDELGGKDPYSASKACAELVAESFRYSYFHSDGARLVGLATARGGNIIGGGDWADDRLIPDIVRAITSNTKLKIRNPASVRPWQHVLSLCHAYLMLASELSKNPKEFSGSWNFGPNSADVISVRDVIALMADSWNTIEVDLVNTSFVETKFLSLSSAKARNVLGWGTPWDVRVAIRKTAEWYNFFYKRKENARDITLGQLTDYRALLWEPISETPWMR